MKAERYENGPMMFQIRGIEGDMDPGPKMDLVISQGGDAFVTIYDNITGERAEITINNGLGGTHTPGLANRLRDVAEYLYNCQKDPDYALKDLARRLQEPVVKPGDNLPG